MSLILGVSGLLVIFGASVRGEENGNEKERTRGGKKESGTTNISLDDSRDTYTF